MESQPFNDRLKMLLLERFYGKKIISILFMTVMSVVSASGYEYSYEFSNTPISEALVMISKEHPDVNISFIYKELDNYRTSSKFRTDDAYDALRKTIGLNPISITERDKKFYIEALQHGKYCYAGDVVGTDNEPVTAATVMLLMPKDSTVITYGITDEKGHFSIPCDRQGVIAKFACLGYLTRYKVCDAFIVGKVVMTESPIRLHSVNVEADNALLLADKSVYRPTQRQKNASQTATELLARMSIPQLDVRFGSSSVATASGQPVAIYIDYVPATAEELRMMKVSDVRSVEYLENPSDPRFQGNRNVINFRMAKYEYGGYVKVLGVENFIVNSGFMQTNARLVERRMTYDIMGYGYYMANDHFGTDQTETYRLPQENGSIRSFKRESLTETSQYRRHNYETNFRALYSGDKTTANSRITIGLDDTPHNDNNGTVRYTDNIIGRSDYQSAAYSKAKYIKYNGYYFFSLPKNNSLTATVVYSYSHTAQASRYSEKDIPSIWNAAKDNTHEGRLVMDYARSFSDKHSLQAHGVWLYEHNRTDYHGSVEVLDKSYIRFGQIGASYSFSTSEISSSVGFGWDWLSTGLNGNNTVSDYPYFDASLNYSPNRRNSFGIIFHYSVWPPSSNYKSENVIQISPFLWHTGNPTLTSHRSYDTGISYTFVPSNGFGLTAFANSWLVGNRAAFVYEATSEGIVRTIKQPIGKFGHYNYGINASAKLSDGKIYLSGRLARLFVHNGMPYNIDRSFISYYLRAMFYVGSFNFAIVYQSEEATDNYDAKSGVWTKNKDAFIIQAGWSNRTWNILITAHNLQRWNWRSSHDVMTSDYYSVNKWISNASGHAFVQLSATYSFGFGKKIKHGDDISKQAGASSGILK